MSALLTIVTGGRPATSLAAQIANQLTLQRWVGDVHVVRWRDDTEVLLDGATVLDVPEGTKGECLNASLHEWRETNTAPGVVPSAIPSLWITMDDDVVLSVHTLDLLGAMVGLNGIQLLGVMNDFVELGRGRTWTLPLNPGRRVQTGSDFCVGGAVHAITGRAIGDLLEARGRVYLEIPRREDEELTNTLRKMYGSEACAIALDVGVAVLPDDGTWPAYRDRILAMHYAGYDPRRHRDAARDRSDAEQA